MSDWCQVHWDQSQAFILRWLISTNQRGSVACLHVWWTQHMAKTTGLLSYVILIKTKTIYGHHTAWLMTWFVCKCAFRLRTSLHQRITEISLSLHLISHTYRCSEANAGLLTNSVFREPRTRRSDASNSIYNAWYICFPHAKQVSRTKARLSEL